MEEGLIVVNNEFFLFNFKFEKKCDHLVPGNVLTEHCHKADRLAEL